MENSFHSLPSPPSSGAPAPGTPRSATLAKGFAPRGSLGSELEPRVCARLQKGMYTHQGVAYYLDFEPPSEGAPEPFTSVATEDIIMLAWDINMDGTPEIVEQLSRSDWDTRGYDAAPSPWEPWSTVEAFGW